MSSCISFDSYIKPQRVCDYRTRARCISFDSYIKPQLCEVFRLLRFVVYLLIPTSNHNLDDTFNGSPSVVYLLIPTSNHNALFTLLLFAVVVYLLIPTSNHNLLSQQWVLAWLYIFWFLHQTTTSVYLFLLLNGCISFDSYIKPQLFRQDVLFNCVVYLLIPTSNHNRARFLSFVLQVVYLLIPTSNHNLMFYLWQKLQVVYLLIPTSNHNRFGCIMDAERLYIFWFLHQTTTFGRAQARRIRCISFDSYIKPQQPSVVLQNY